MFPNLQADAPIQWYPSGLPSQLHNCFWRRTLDCLFHSHCDRTNSYRQPDRSCSWCWVFQCCSCNRFARCWWTGIGMSSSYDSKHTVTDTACSSCRVCTAWMAWEGRIIFWVGGMTFESLLLCWIEITYVYTQAHTWRTVWEELYYGSSCTYKEWSQRISNHIMSRSYFEWEVSRFDE